jgi:hypothetical protein
MTLGLRRTIEVASNWRMTHQPGKTMVDALRLIDLRKSLPRWLVITAPRSPDQAQPTDRRMSSFLHTAEVFFDLM